MDPAKLKVVELRAELQDRGLDIKGVKAVLVERLREALEKESGQDIPETSIVETSTDETSLLEDKSYHSAAESFTEQEKDNSSDKEQSEQEYLEPDQDSTSAPERQEQSPEPERDLETEQEAETQESYEEENTRETEEPPSEQESEAKDNLEEDTRQEGTEESQDIDESQDAEDSQNMENSKVKEEDYYEDNFKEQNYEEKPDISEYQGYGDPKKENYEADVKMESEVDVKEENHGQDRKRKRSSRWSPQPQQKQGWGQSQSWGRKDDEPELDDEAVTLGWYDSDLNLEIDKTNFLVANPMSFQGFGYIWAGCRATYGFNRGSVCYEVKLLENNDVSHLEDEPSPHVLRVGWSVLTASMLLGEEVGSFGYGGTGMASTNCKFTKYGTTFVAGDTVTAYLDYGEKVTMSFAVNGVHQGKAFTIPASEINNQPLFPHLLSKNVKFQANFGQSESEVPIESGFTWAAKVAADEREPGPRRPDRREDCEILMMCGLPGCGKTTWANKYVLENPGKFYNILGTNNLIDKMKIQGLPRKRNYSGRWDVLIDKCTKCLNKLLEMAAKRRRSYILDQTNVYPSAQKRKMRNFAGFVRRAIVIVPSDEEFQRRCAKREAEEGKDIPDSAVLEMKANFKLPEVGESFDEVRYIELNEEESRPLVEQYNKEGKAAGFGQQAPFSGQGKKFKSDRPSFRGGGGERGFRGGRGSGFGGVMDRRDRSDDRGPGGGRGFRAGGPPMKGGMDRGGRGGWQPRGGGDRGPPRGGGWRDRSPPGFDREERGGGGGPWRNNRSNDRDRPYDRNQRGRGGRPGGFDRDNYRDNDYGRGGGGGFRDGGDFRGGYDRDEFPRGGGGGYNSRDGGGGGGFREGRGGGRGRGGGGGFDRDRGGGGRGGFDRRGGGGGFNDRRGGGNREGGGFDRNRGGSDRGPRENKGGSNNGNAEVQGQTQAQQGWGNQGYNQGWGQGGGYNQGGYNQGGYNQGFNQQANQQAAWGQQQGWGNKAGYTAGANQQQPAQAAAVAGATTAATGYNTTGYAQQAGYNQQYAQAQGYNWGQYGYGQGWTQNADGTYSYPQGWQQYGYNYGQAATPMATPAGAAATPAAPVAAAPK